jgi:hypothetical protein
MPRLDQSGLFVLMTILCLKCEKLELVLCYG